VKVEAKEDIERLETMENSAKSDKAGKVVADSLKSALEQAIHTSDVKMLNDLLLTQKPTVVLESLIEIEPRFIVPFLKIVTKTLLTGNADLRILRCVQVLIQYKASVVMTSGVLMDCALLHKVIDARLTHFRSLTKLNGRLEMLLNYMQTRNEEVNVEISKTPISTYKEVEEVEDEEEDEEDENSDEDENEKEDLDENQKPIQNGHRVVKTEDRDEDEDKEKQDEEEDEDEDEKQIKKEEEEDDEEEEEEGEDEEDDDKENIRENDEEESEEEDEDETEEKFKPSKPQNKKRYEKEDSEEDEDEEEEFENKKKPSKIGTEKRK